jgi:hypothetical protein
MPIYTAKQGDCIASISAEFGFAPDAIWGHPQNATLKALRQDLHVLMPGDEVFIPEKELRVEARATDARHQFVRTGIPEFLSLRFLKEQQPRAGERYTLAINGQLIAGELDADGACEVPIPPRSKSATITLGDPAKGDVYQLLLGHLDPHDEISGVEKRLSNLGYLRTGLTGQDTPDLREAVKAFQADYDLPSENGLDDPTRLKLKTVHGS